MTGERLIAGRHTPENVRSRDGVQFSAHLDCLNSGYARHPRDIWPQEPRTAPRRFRHAARPFTRVSPPQRLSAR
ncbi:hypothetical protein NOVOSPHI9U_40391 [Novosphingobium sp. 9U]|nr:hypothetical protein NOVOSPHI9U_40391 [Novosphingobium sp. 9U]